MWCLISALGCHRGRSCPVQFCCGPLGHRTSPLSSGAPSHPWLSLAGMISHRWNEETSAKPAPCSGSFHNPVGGSCLLVGFGKALAPAGVSTMPPYGESSAALVCDSSVPDPREKSVLPEDSSVGTQGDVGQALKAVIHRQHLPVHHPFPAKEKGSRVCQGLWPLVSSLHQTPPKHTRKSPNLHRERCK